MIQLSNDSAYYAQVIDVGTKRDVEKRQCAKDNKLNYVVFWDNDLADAKAWLLNWKLYHQLYYCYINIIKGTCCELYYSEVWGVNPC